MNTIVLVEGVSDRIAVETLAEKHGRDLAGEGVEVLPVGGAQAVGRAVRGLPAGTRVAGLCDVGEERYFRRALAEAAVESLGCFVCHADLEDELIRAVGAAAVEAVVEANGDLRPLRTLQRQDAWAGRPLAAQLRRFMGSGGSRKLRYARVLVETLGVDDVPQPLRELLAGV